MAVCDDCTRKNIEDRLFERINELVHELDELNRDNIRLKTENDLYKKWSKNAA